MVLDIRNANGATDAAQSEGVYEVEQVKPVVSPVLVEDTVASNTDAAASDDGFSAAVPVALEDLLDTVVDGESLQLRAAAVAQLRSLVPSDEGLELLCRVVESVDDRRRNTAVQILGHHRQWLSSKPSLERALAWLRLELDPEVATSMAWCMRHKDVLAEFLLHPAPGVAREAALGMPVTAKTLPSLVRVLLMGRSPEVDRILSQKLKAINNSQTISVAQLLLDWEGEVSEEELNAAIGCLPQVPLFVEFVEQVGQSDWRPAQTPKEADQARSRHRITQLIERSLLRSPSGELVRHMINRIGQDDSFARRHTSFLRAAATNTEAVFGTELVDDLARLTIGASEEKLARMAQMLMELTHKLDVGSKAQAEALLEQWMTKSPNLKLKIYHMQQGIS